MEGVWKGCFYMLQSLGIPVNRNCEISGHGRYPNIGLSEIRISNIGFSAFNLWNIGYRNVCGYRNIGMKNGEYWNIAIKNGKNRIIGMKNDQYWNIGNLLYPNVTTTLFNGRCLYCYNQWLLLCCFNAALCNVMLYMVVITLRQRCSTERWILPTHM